MKFHCEIIIFLRISEGVPKLFWHTLFGFRLNSWPRRKDFPKIISGIFRAIIGLSKNNNLTPRLSKTFKFWAKVSQITGVNQLLFWINFWGCPGYLKITVTLPLAQVRILSWDFFPLYFFYSFYQILIRSWDVELHTKFQPHKIFLKELFNIFRFGKNRFS